ncbi:MAG: IS630 family transposase [Limnothrix sp. BL-A-16]
MGRYSLDLRRKIVEAYEKGDTSIRKVAKQFSISPDTVRRLLNLYRSTGSLVPKKCGTKRVSILSQNEEAILEIVETNPDFTLREYCEAVQEKLGVSSNTSMMDRFLKQHDISLKKKTYRSEKVITAEVQAERVSYWQRILKVEAEKLVFIDESGFWVGMNRPMARAKKGMKAYETQKPYYGKKMTVISAIRRSGVVTIKGLKGSMKKEDFLEFVKVNLAPQLKAGDVVIMDNLNSHHRPEVKEMIEAVGATVEYLPVYSPDFNPIEMMWSQLKIFLWKFRTETIEVLEQLTRLAARLVDLQCLKNWFTKCCYCT